MTPAEQERKRKQLEEEVEKTRVGSSQQAPPSQPGPPQGPPQGPEEVGLGEAIVTAFNQAFKGFGENLPSLQGVRNIGGVGLEQGRNSFIDFLADKEKGLGNVLENSFALDPNADFIKDFQKAIDEFGLAIDLLPQNLESAGESLSERIKASFVDSAGLLEQAAGLIPDQLNLGGAINFTGAEEQASAALDSAKQFISKLFEQYGFGGSPPPSPGSIGNNQSLN